MTYRASSRDYLSRARARLADGTEESLFYAAFELRCGIEERMKRYLDVWEHVSRKKKKGWRIAELAQNVEDAFKTGERIVRLSFFTKESHAQVASFYYTPVTAKLTKAGEVLGNYLHCRGGNIPSNHKFWEDLRERLKDTATQLDFVSKGTLLGPPLTRQDSSPVRQMDMRLELPEDIDAEAVLRRVAQKGILAEIKYVTDLPSNLRNQSHAWTLASLNCGNVDRITPINPEID